MPFKHAPDGSVITVRTELVQDANRVRISVIDQGKGLKDVDLDRYLPVFIKEKKQRAGQVLVCRMPKSWWRNIMDRLVLMIW